MRFCTKIVAVLTAILLLSHEGHAQRGQRGATRGGQQPTRGGATRGGGRVTRGGPKDGADSGAPHRAGIKGGGGAKAMINGFRGGPLPDDDTDYEQFYKRVPKEDYMRARVESTPSAGKEAQGGKPFEFKDLDYPKGDENSTSYRFDMGPADGPVKEGYTPITSDDLFTWKKGFGWVLDKPQNDYQYKGTIPGQKIFDYGIVQNQHIRREFEKRGRFASIASIKVQAGADTFDFYDTQLDEVSKDAVLNTEELAFKVTLPNGRYMVSMVLGDMQLPRLGMDVFANGNLVASNIFTGLVQFRGYTQPSSPWPMRITFPVDAVRNNIRIALRANDNLFLERAEVTGETPDYNHSKYAIGRLYPFMGKRMNTHGPATQMAIAGITITPHVNPPFTLFRQKLFADKAVTNVDALAGLKNFNDEDYVGAEADFAKIPDSEYMLKAYGYLALTGLLETEAAEELRLSQIAIDILEKGVKSNPDDILAADLLKPVKYFNKGVYFTKNASQFNLNTIYPQAACLFNWTTPNDILYSKALMHYARCFSSIDAHRWTPTWHVAEEAFLKLEDIEPGNRFSGYFLYENMDGWAFKDYSADLGDAPKWAGLMREAHNRVLDQTEWWGLNKQKPDGGLGGGWGDDVEIGLVWQAAMLPNPGASDIAMDTVRKIAEGCWWSGDIDRDVGYFDGLADVEHTAEWTGDTQAFMMGLEYGNPTYFERNLQTAKLMRDLWMGKNKAGHLHFKSMMLGNKAVGKTGGGVRDAEIDHPLNGRAASPAYWAWWYSPVDELDRIFSEWAEAWYEDSMREENGKPARVIPGPIGYYTDVLGGNESNKWRHGAPKANCYENPQYANYVLNLFAMMYAKTGDEKWLKPAAARTDSKTVFLDDLTTAEGIVADRNIEDKYSLLGYVGDPNSDLLKEKTLESILAFLPKVWPHCTSEVASTDRVYMPGTVEILKLMLGGQLQAGLEFVPVTLADTSNNVAFMNLASSKKGAKTIFYNFNENDEPVQMKLWKLEVGGEYEVKVGIDDNDDDKIDKVIKSFPYKQVHRGDAIKFVIPARKAVVVDVEQTKAGKGMPKRVVDLAMAPVDINYDDGNLSVTVHNIGNLDCGKFKVNVWQGEAKTGKLLKSFERSSLEAPNDLEPRLTTESISWQLPKSATTDKPVRITVEIDADDAHYEITEVNNVISRDFPYVVEEYMKPRMWPSLSKQYGVNGTTRPRPFFPAGTPKSEIR
ncbi:hypothetical protein ACFL1X_01240 [Candidatus Hydrogenedentota bacterium]